MSSQKIMMHANKQYELLELKDKINESFMKRWTKDVEYKDYIYHDFYATKSLLLIYEKWYIRTGSYTGLVISINEAEKVQYADIIATGGKETFFSYGAEDDFASLASEVLLELGFIKNR